MIFLANQPSIFPFGIRIDEPMTTITDLMVTAVCFYAFFRLNRHKSDMKVLLFLKYYFLGMGIATFFGGMIGHAFLYAFSFAWKLPGWITSMLAVMLLERAAIEHASAATNPKTITFFKWINIIELLTFMTLTFATLNFKFVEYHSAYGIMFVVGSFSLFTYIRTKSKASKIFIIAVVIAIISSIIYLTRFSIDIWFNYLDFSHVIMAIAAYVFYIGAEQMYDENKKNHIQGGK
jgi:hypothetical protein